MGQVAVALSRTLTPDSWNSGYDVEKSVISNFPDIKNGDGQIFDAWSHPIRIEIKRSDKHFDVAIRSAGQDGIFNTKDDCVDEWQLNDK